MPRAWGESVDLDGVADPAQADERSVSGWRRSEPFLERCWVTSQGAHGPAT